MKRGRLKNSEWSCYHITHRCRERRLLLKFEIDRKNYLNRLWEASIKYSISVLDYMVTSNHVHLLIFSPDADTVSEVMKYIQETSMKIKSKDVFTVIANI